MQFAGDFELMQTAVVTGVRGFIGRYVARCLNQRGYHVVGVGRGAWTEGYAEWGIASFVSQDLTLEGLSI